MFARFHAFNWLLCSILLATTTARAGELLVEAESFQQRGGWQLDTQFIEQMGSPYLLAHGLGQPVADAVTKATLPESGKYTVWVRTFDWVARWKAPGTPGRFALTINGKQISDQLGTEGSQWHWQKAGEVQLEAGAIELKLHDLMGFDGRCDAIYLTTDAAAKPDNSNEVMSSWRRQALGLKDAVETKSGYDLVVVGGGYSGMGAAISAARMGCKVALLQDRGVLGGNGSSEVRVWAQGLIRRGKFPRIGEIIEEFADKATASPAPAEQFGDELKLKVIQAEKNIDLFLHHHAFRVAMQGKKLESVDAIDALSSQIRRFSAPLFVDCTGHAWIGALASADWEMTPEGRMGMSNMWTWLKSEDPRPFRRRRGPCP